MQQARQQMTDFFIIQNGGRRVTPEDAIRLNTTVQDTRHTSSVFAYVPCVIPKLGIEMPEMGNATITRDSRPARRKAAASLPAASTSLADALFTTTQQRVLALLFGQPVRSFTGKVSERW